MKDVADDLALIVRNAIAYIKELERQVNALKRAAEPVAWVHTDPDKPRIQYLEWRENEPGYRGNWMKKPLYAAPPKRKPLTEEEIHSLFRTSGSPTAFARAIEAKHEITS